MRIIFFCQHSYICPKLILKKRPFISLDYEILNNKIQFQIYQPKKMRIYTFLRSTKYTNKFFRGQPLLSITVQKKSF